MANKKTYSRGDIIKVSLNPTTGSEIKADHVSVLVLSEAGYNALGLVLAAPIVQGGDISRYAGFATLLKGSGTDTQGAVLANMARMLDLNARAGEFIEKAPQSVVNDAIARLQTVLD